MLVLLLSPVPMVRGFGVLLVVGVAIALLCALTAGAAAIALSRPAGADAPAVALGGAALAGLLAPAWRGARELLRDNPLTAPDQRAALVGAVRHPGARARRSASRWRRSAGGSTRRRRCRPTSPSSSRRTSSSLQNLNTLEQITGVGGEIDLMIEGKNLTKPATIEWMSAYQKRVLARFGYSAAQRLRQGAACARRSRCPTCSKARELVAHRPCRSSRRRRSAACWA